MSAAGVLPLPHGPEFLFVDRVLERRPGRCVVACLDLAAPSRRLPYSGTLPSSYLLEAMIQTCGLLLEDAPSSGAAAVASSPGLAMVAALDRVRWLGHPRERERVLTRCRLVRRAQPFILCRCSARGEDGRLLAKGDVTIAGPSRRA